MRLLKSAAVAVAVLAASFSHSFADNFKLAVTDVEGLERLQVEWGPFKEALENATEHTFEFFPVTSRTAAAEALRAKRVDFVVTGPAEYIVINKLTEATPLIGLGRPDYYCAIVVRADSGLTRPADLKGKKVAFGDIGSTSNMLCPMQLMADYDVDPVTDIEKLHTSRNIAHEALKKGDIDGMGTNHNSWINVRNKDESVPNGFFRVIARSGDLPNDMLMVASHVDPATADGVRTSILDNKDAIVSAILQHEENDKYSGMDLVAIEDGAYDLVRSMYSTAGFPQYDNFIGE
ncbi:MAG: PhnD/SsuA/transferrin family substrate-binding protein [Roseibium sp.]|uniref:phosphate/phosphite/phosphonate ABC transporter substrate-binding protein n=1 Tax=Roseibium sp. TaxID=1936156 RepID=UPI00261A44F0|nr:PhnD/SsuA/transferrin family substrate-binding protein [Roseibium sp.]MCV0424972.1 PhnD/SsuA/transferrin family substrate-binding protein [Roseibium sp.]